MTPLRRKSRAHARLVSMLALWLTACGGGSDGAPGPQGPQGPQGPGGPQGPQGPGVQWVTVTGTAQQMAPNTGYITTSSSGTTFTLPPSSALQVGDVVRIHGAAGPWTLNQNAAQTILTHNLPGEVPGLRWIERPAVQSAFALASSADGMQLIAGTVDTFRGSGPLYRSTDGGATWAVSGPSKWWISVASSADGKTLLAAAQENVASVWCSNDGGSSWTSVPQLPVGTQSVALSANSTKAIAAGLGTRLYTSRSACDGSWFAPNSSLVGAWAAVAISGDGSRRAAAALRGVLYVSSDPLAVSWTETSRVSNASASLAMSYDGMRIAAALDGSLYLSADGGTTWGSASLPTVNQVAMSADGQRLIVTSGFRGLYTSTDGGATWRLRFSAPTLLWHAVTSSADGSRLAAASQDGSVYTSAMSSTPGMAGGLSGPQHSVLELQYIGDDSFAVLSSSGSITAR